VKGSGIFILARAATYSSLFIGFLLVFLPAGVLARSGVGVPDHFGVAQAAGMLVALAGGGLALGSILTFVVVGKGTPAPFDPPRRLVVRGPYRAVRNPMYIGAGAALGGAALYYTSLALLGYALAFMATMHLFAVLYEEPVLRDRFGAEYQEYCRRVARWLPFARFTR